MRRIWIILTCLLLLMGSMTITASAAVPRKVPLSSAQTLVNELSKKGNLPMKIQYTQKEKKEIINEQKEVAQRLQEEGSLAEMDAAEMDGLIQEVRLEE